MLMPTASRVNLFLAKFKAMRDSMDLVAKLHRLLFFSTIALVCGLAVVERGACDPYPQTHDESVYNDPSVGLWFGSSIAACTRDTKDLQTSLEHIASNANNERGYLSERIAADTATYRLAKLKCLQAAIRAHFSEVNGASPNDAKLKDLKNNPEMVEIINRMSLWGKNLQGPGNYRCDTQEDKVACGHAHFLRQQNDAGVGWAMETIANSLKDGMANHGSRSLQKVFSANAERLQREAAALNKTAIQAEASIPRPRSRPQPQVAPASSAD